MSPLSQVIKTCWGLRLDVSKQKSRASLKSILWLNKISVYHCKFGELTEGKSIICESTGAHRGFNGDTVRGNVKVCGEYSPEVAKLQGPSREQMSVGWRSKGSNGARQKLSMLLSGSWMPTGEHLPGRQSDEPPGGMSNSLPHPSSCWSVTPVCCLPPSPATRNSH